MTLEEKMNELAREKMEEGKKIGMAEGLREGHKEGLREGTLEIAKAMKADGFDNDRIAKLTRLTKEEIENL